ncbi:Speckle-type POZ protein [Araneus ventricosus]|uniref:Speckle-type POZ protein n=1 Tax=Araneus ventricosus TaxID=182803 RepID=A0A4Y2KI98_ARAVE|nr:Speckle-type POZ protein [Araneus ventricosus]
MAGKENEGKCFLFIWKLENISYSLADEIIESPSFVVDAMDKTKWKLELYPRGERSADIGVYLYRRKDLSDVAIVEVIYELAFIGKDGSVLVSTKIEHTFPRCQGFGEDSFVNREEVYDTKRLVFLPQDTLTVRCKMWKKGEEMLQDVRCTARSRIGIRRRTFFWNLENFSTLEPERKCNYLIRSIENDEPILNVDLFVTATANCDEIIRFELSLQNEVIGYSTLRLSLLDASGNRVNSSQHEFWFTGYPKCTEFSFFLTRKELLGNKSLYLPNDILSLQWEWAFSEGVVSKEIEEVQFGCTCPRSKICDAHKLNNKKTPLNALIDNLKSLYDEHFLSDIKLKTKTSEFQAHKLILSASSSVFKSMFLRDMIEKDSDCVNIEDLSDDTVGRMLLYIYTTRLEDLTWQRASDLYVAADKYAILRLKNECSSFLKENLSPSNACEALLLSELHGDHYLKSAVQDYIVKQGKQITKSDEWEVLKERNAKLAAETLALLFE